MADKSAIEWTDATWNPVRGCSRITTGCGGPNHEGGCYAEKIAARFSDPGQPFHGFAERTPHGGRWTGKLALIEDQLTLPLRWKKPRRIFVNSMSDLFHENLPDEAIDKVFAVMALCPQHTFQVLTKRAARMRAYLNHLELPQRIAKAIDADRSALGFAAGDRYYATCFDEGVTRVLLPLPNLWLGVSAERQEEADERIPHLLQTPAAVRFVSAEPLLGPIDFTHIKLTGIVDPFDAFVGATWSRPPSLGGARFFSGAPRQRGAPHIDWIIVGGESGPKARPMHVGWARDIRDQCAAAGVAFFFKQFGEWHPRMGKPGLADHCIAINGAISSGDKMEGGPERSPRWLAVERVGKKAAGRLLDGREHNDFPRTQ